ncbi:hypothetical protein BKE38_02305 [Pseudoroseomonas deserti]|uniref:DUF3775 domain-containing protein n=1 Tax=Teichococcus deserti TaxID=1817963 RepID=A0A1V2H9G1_9PROT|nr:DUF3775 domain-containing protein [Pseudoroseomonas deserti]ONG58710.1 hypothetical protein BKE38_02305 [Pseudoroseomonas deserti]
MSDTSRDEDDDGEFDLGISLEAVATVVDHIRAIQDDEPDAEDDDDGDGDEDDSDADFDEDTLSAFIEEMNEDEQAALVALAWIGRGDYEAEEWEEALRLAKERGAAGGDTAGYLLGMDMAGDLLAEGLAAFGASIEEIER